MMMAYLFSLADSMVAGSDCKPLCLSLRNLQCTDSDLREISHTRDLFSQYNVMVDSCKSLPHVYVLRSLDGTRYKHAVWHSSQQKAESYTRRAMLGTLKGLAPDTSIFNGSAWTLQTYLNGLTMSGFELANLINTLHSRSERHVASKTEIRKYYYDRITQLVAANCPYWLDEIRSWGGWYWLEQSRIHIGGWHGNPIGLSLDGNAKLLFHSPQPTGPLELDYAKIKLQEVMNLNLHCIDTNTRLADLQACAAAAELVGRFYTPMLMNVWRKLCLNLTLHGKYAVT
jgi:hypothetical protein